MTQIETYEELARLFPQCELTLDITIKTSTPCSCVTFCMKLLSSEGIIPRSLNLTSDILTIRIPCEDHEQIGRLEFAFSEPGTPRLLRWAATIGQKRFLK